MCGWSNNKVAYTKYVHTALVQQDNVHANIYLVLPMVPDPSASP